MRLKCAFGNDPLKYPWVYKHHTCCAFCWLQSLTNSKISWQWLGFQSVPEITKDVDSGTWWASWWSSSLSFEEQCLCLLMCIWPWHLICQSYFCMFVILVKQELGLVVLVNITTLKCAIASNVHKWEDINNWTNYKLNWLVTLAHYSLMKESLMNT